MKTPPDKINPPHLSIIFSLYLSHFLFDDLSSFLPCSPDLFPIEEESKA
jgi:hypothetical protein